MKVSKKCFLPLIFLFTSCLQTTPIQQDSITHRQIAATNRSIHVEVNWRTVVGRELNWHNSAIELGGIALSNSGNILVVTSSSGQVFGLDTEDGHRRWARSLGSGAQSTPTIFENTAYVLTDNGRIMALDVETGSPHWIYESESIFHGRAAVNHSFVLTTTNTETLIALERETGELAWSYQGANSPAMITRGTATPLVIEDQIYAGFSDGSFVRLDETGQVEWEMNLAENEIRFADIEGITSWRESLFVTSFNGGVYRITKDGEIVWHQDIHGTTAPVLVGEKIVTTTADGDVIWLDFDNGDILERLSLEGGAAGEITSAAGYLFIPLSHQGVTIVDANTPWIHHRFAPGHGVSTQTIMAGHSLYSLTHGGFVYELTLSSR